MPRPDAPPLTRAVVLRGLGFGLAITLGAVAVWLIVTGSTNPRRIEIGVLAGLWGLLLGAYTMFGARRQHGEVVHYVSSGELEVRSSGGLEPAAQAEARRAFEERLEHLVRSEISSSVSREVGDLRREVAQLRQDLVEKLGGQLRLERIETTRLFGSDLEALQDEVRQLKTARDSAGGQRVVDAAPIPVAAERVGGVPQAVRDDAAAATRAIEAQAATERRRADIARAEQAARERAAYEQASRERAERERAERQRVEREKAQREQAARERAAAAQAERERVKAESARVERERLARERAERERAAAEKAAREKAERERAAADKVAAEKVARDKAAAERTAREQAEREQAEREQAEREQVEREQVEREQAEREREREKVEREQVERAQAARERAAAEQAAAARSASDDPFASLPRITPFTDFELDPIESPSASGGAGYTGRRRADGVDTDGAADAGRHSRHGGEDRNEDRNDGRRRRRDDDDEDGLDLLTQLLSRGSAEH